MPRGGGEGRGGARERGSAGSMGTCIHSSTTERPTTEPEPDATELGGYVSRRTGPGHLPRLLPSSDFRSWPRPSPKPGERHESTGNVICPMPEQQFGHPRRLPRRCCRTGYTRLHTNSKVPTRRDGDERRVWLLAYIARGPTASHCVSTVHPALPLHRHIRHRHTSLHPADGLRIAARSRPRS